MRRREGGTWEIPDEFTERVGEGGSAGSRYPRVAVFSFLSLESQVTADGATWLDRELVARERTGLRGERFGRAAADALARRRDYLIGHGLAERDGETARYRRNLPALFHRRELATAGERIAKKIGMAFTEMRNGDRIKGVYRRTLRLASSKVAVIERKAASSPSFLGGRCWNEDSGRSFAGRMRGGSVSFYFTRKRGIGMG